MSGLGDILQGMLPGSDPNSPNTFLPTADEVARRQALADALMKNGSDYSPIQSPWQGLARMTQGAIGGFESGELARERNQARTAAGAGDTAAQGYLSRLAGVLGGVAPPAGSGSPGLASAIANSGQPSGLSDRGSLPAVINALGGQGALAGETVAATPGGGIDVPTRGNVDTSGLNQKFADHLQDFMSDAADAGIPAHLISGARSNDLQAQLYNNYKNGTGGVAAPPGQSFHNFGLAGDVLADNPAQQAALIKFARENPQYGLTSLGAFDPPHFQMALNGAQGGAPMGSALSVGSQGDRTSPGDLAKLGTAMTAAQPPSQGFGLVTPAMADGAPPDPRLAQAAALNAPMPAAPAAAPLPPPRPPGLGGAPAAPGQHVQFVGDFSGLPGAPGSAQPSPAVAGATPAVGTMSGRPPPAPSQVNMPVPTAQPASGTLPQGGGAPAPSQAGPQGTSYPGFARMTPEETKALLSTLSNPWATPQQQQVAMMLLQSQMPGQPTWGVIGKGADGSESYGFVYPKGPNGPHVTDANGAPIQPGQGGYNIPSSPTAPSGAPAGAQGAPSAAPPDVGAGTPNASGNGAKIPNLPPIGATPEGLAWLNSAAQQGGNAAMVARRAMMIINGQAQLPDGSGTGPTKPFDIAVIDAVNKAAPGYSATLAASRAKTITEFQDKSSLTSRGGLVQNMNAAVGHLADLSDLSEKLPTTSNSPNAPNHLINAATGLVSAGPKAATLASYNAAKNIVAQEVTKFYEGGAGTEADREALIANLSPDASPSERRAAIATISKLIQTKGTEIQRDWHQGTGAPDGEQFDYPIYGPEAMEGMARIAQRGHPNFGVSPAAASAAGAAPKTLSADNPDADWQALPSGARFVGPDGKTRVKP